MRKIDYIVLELIPFLIFCAAVISFLLLGLFQTISYCACKDFKYGSCVLKYLRMSGNIWLDQALRYKFEDKKERISIGNYEFLKHRATLLSAVPILVGLTCLQVFWDVWLVSDGTDCEPKNDKRLECFFSIMGPAYNCSSATDLVGTNASYISFRCYQYVFEFTEAFADAGGTLTACALSRHG